MRGDEINRESARVDRRLQERKDLIHFFPLASDDVSPPALNAVWKEPPKLTIDTASVKGAIGTKRDQGQSGYQRESHRRCVVF